MMKKIALIIILMSLTPGLFAQSQVSTKNSVVETTVRMSGYKTVAELNGLPVESVNRTIQYLDGLGRPLQTVQWQGSPLKKDLVQPFGYDAFGREVKKYLPYAAVGNNGIYRADALQGGAGLINFYHPGATGSSGEQIGTSGVARIPNPYAETDFEASPLNRVKQQASPGTDWALASGHTQKMAYGINVADEVKLWVIGTNGASAVNSRYAAGTLYKTTVWDENSTSTTDLAGATEEFKDFEGRVVLKRVWKSSTEKLSTYYVYDDLGNLRYVLPPALHENGQDPIETFADDDTHFNNFIYAYRYDGRKRLTEKKIPGKGWEYLVYNQLDQVVLSQDAIQESNHEWLFSKYDTFGRVVQTGIYTDVTALATLRNTISSAAVIWEHKITTGLGYSNEAFPTSNTEVLTVNYYDDYTFPGNTLGNPSGSAEMNGGRIIGLQTGSLVKVLGSSDLLLTVNFYDEEGRVIRSKSQHYLSGSINASNYDEVSNTFSFVGELLTSTRVHYTTGGNTTIFNEYTYDHQGRKLNSSEQINGQPKVTLSGLAYNEIGQLKSKGLHSVAGSPFIQTVAYSYNERGWITGINDPNTINSSKIFGMSLSYANSANTYNGNISSATWKTMVPAGLGLTEPLQTFSYNYDKLDRLTKAGYSTASELDKFNEEITYDMMGNITSLLRKNTVSNYLNNFTYNYIDGSAKGNRLMGVIDAGTAAQNSSYSYDLNGNQKTNSLKGITNISYNFLNLPYTISKAGTGEQLVYTYDATGRKLRKQAGSQVTNYVDGIQYNGPAIDFIMTEEGRAIPGSSYSYEYFLKDHLGNTRATVKQDGSIIQVQDYYAFGLEMNPGNQFSGSPVNNYKYNGKEKQTELGLDQLDYGARFYDPVIGRWNVIDPLAEQMRRYSPYNYGFNNPIRFVDPDGMAPNDWYQSADNKTVKWFDGDGYQEGYSHIGSKGAVISGNGAINLNDDGTATNAQTGDFATSSTSGQTKIEVNLEASSMKSMNSMGQNLAMFSLKFVKARAFAQLVSTLFPSNTYNAPDIQYPENNNTIQKPEGWITEATKKGEGTIMRDPNSPHNSIREMPGNPNSINPAQQKPYVIFRKDGVSYDVSGNPVQSTDPAAHIPAYKFDMSKMPKFN